ncbi:nuclease A inhibitor family protein [Spirosoma fluminis]
MTNESDERNGQTVEEQLRPLLVDLYYPGESDEPVDVVTCYLRQAEPLTVSQIKDWQLLPPSIYVEEIPETEFWEPVSTDEAWYDDEEKARTAKFQQIRQVMESELSVRQVFRVGETEIDVYLLGRQANGERVGIKTKIVQT